MQTFLVVLVMGVAVWYVLHRHGGRGFWKIVRRRPDFALPWFEAHGEWVIRESGQPSLRGDAYTIGFTVLNPLTGQFVKVYCRRDQLEASQLSFLEDFKRYREREN